MLFWHVPAPNEALLISGSKHRDPDGPQFRIVTGHGAFVMPIKQKARILSLALREAEIVEDCVTNQGITLSVRAVSVFKVGDDAVSIANAGRRFLSEQDQMENLVGRVFAGHLRSIIGGLRVEEIIRERDRVAQEITASSHHEMEKLGLVVDSLQIQEIDDATGYIRHLAAPHAAAVERSCAHSRAGSPPTPGIPWPPAPAPGCATRRGAREAVQAQREMLALPRLLHLELQPVGLDEHARCVTSRVCRSQNRA